MDIGSISVKQGEIRVRSGFHHGGNIQLSAGSISIGSGTVDGGDAGGGAGGQITRADGSGSGDAGSGTAEAPSAIVHVAGLGTTVLLPLLDVQSLVAKLHL